jgi:nucleotide-binding universal stress UspA family protein/predicted transcriptional regulator
MSRCLVVPLDGSERAEAALPWAVLLARAQGLSIALVRATPPPYLVTAALDESLPYLAPETYETMRLAELDAATAYLAGAQTRVAADGIAVETISREGDPANTMLDVADERGAIAVVLATHGRGGLQRFVLGSVAERLVAQATIPILLIRAPEGAPARPADLSRLLVPLDGSPLAERALDLAQGLAPADATLTLARVVAPVRHALPGVGAVGSYVDGGATEHAAGEARADLDRVRQTLAGERLVVQTTVRHGRAADEILSAAHEADASLIVLSTHGRTGPQRWLLGSVADAVVRGAEIPVLLVSTRAVAARAQLPFVVRELMTPDVAAVRADEPVLSALRKLLRHHASSAPVVDAAGRLVGVVSEHDLLIWDQALLDLIAGDPGLAPEDYRWRVLSTTVADIMSRTPVTIAETAALTAAIHLFVQHELRHLPVVRDGRLVGSLARADVLRALATQLDTAATAPTAGPVVTPTTGGARQPQQTSP